MYVSDLFVMYILCIATIFGLVFGTICFENLRKVKKKSKLITYLSIIIFNILILIYLWYNFIVLLNNIKTNYENKEELGSQTIYVTEVTPNYVATGKGAYLKRYKVTDWEIIESSQNKVECLKVRYAENYIFNNLFVNVTIDDYKICLTKDLCEKLEDNIWYADE